MEEHIYDLIIAGAGPSGITASIYAARQKMDTLVLTGDIGGQTIWSGDIENYAGISFITGMELTAKLEEHMQKYGIAVHENEHISELVLTDGLFRVSTAKGAYKARTVIVSTGKRSKELNVPGENEFRNKGVAYCAVCDGPLFFDKDVAVIGGGNSAIEAALQLGKIAKSIVIVNDRASLGGETILREKVLSLKNVRVLNSSKVKEIFGKKFVTAITIVDQNGTEVMLEVQGVFVEIGLLPNTGFRHPLSQNAAGEILVNCSNETNIPGVFAAGDVTNVPEKQIIIAAGEGAKAALSAFRYLAKVKR